MLQKMKSAPINNLDPGGNTNPQVCIHEQQPKDVQHQPTFVSRGGKRSRVFSDKFSDENINPQNWDVPQTESCVISSSTSVVQRIPLSPLPFGIRINSDNGFQNPQLISKKNKSDTGANSTYGSTIVNSPMSLDVHSTQELRQSAVASPCDEDTTPQSEIVNPSSVLCSSKSVVQPLSIIQSISSIQFTNQENYDNQVRTEEGDTGFEFLSRQSEIAESKDLGDPSYECHKCQARMWYDERADRCTRANPPQFTMCCMKGKVKISFLDRPPPLLDSLLNGQDPRSGNYKENIRAYNNMFSFTSIGGKVESSREVVLCNSF